MNIETAVKAFEKNGFRVKQFDTAKDAAEFISADIAGKTIGIGGSMTVKDMGLYEMLSENNTVYWHWITSDNETRDKANSAQVYITSANAVSETGEIVNIDGTGNRISSALYGHERVIIIVGKNKIAEDLDAAVFRARNVAAPLNARRLNRRTPCALSEPMKCHNCSSPERICNGLTVTMRKMGGIKDMDIIIIGEDLGY